MNSLRESLSSWHFGIKQKTLLVLVSVLAISTVLDALLASYYTNKQNQEAAYANLDNELLAWQSDLGATTRQLKQVALSTVGDAVVLNQIAEITTQEFNIENPERVSERPEMERTLAYRKIVSLNRLQFALRSGGFSSISVYSRGKLSHYVSDVAAGMRIRRKNGNEVWVSTTADEDGYLPFQNWPAWQQQSIPPHLAITLKDIPKHPQVDFLFPAQQQTMIEIAVPVQGVVEEVLTDAERSPKVKFFSELNIAGMAAPAEDRNSQEYKQPTTFVVVVFRKSIGREAMEELAKKTGKMPILLSPDGSHRQHLTSHDLVPQDLLHQVNVTQTSPARKIIQRTVSDGNTSYYLALLPWQYEQTPRLILGLAASRDSTMQNIRQTVAAILGAAAVILLLSLLVGILWVKRLIDPIVQLTSAVRENVSRNHLGNGHVDQHLRLQPIEVEAPDEVGALAQAFNAMTAELQQLLDTLEQRVQDRTAELRQQTRYLRTLIDMLPMLAWFKDTQSRFLVVNQATADAAARPAESFIGKTDLDIWPKALAESYLADDREVMLSHQRKTVEERIADTRGENWIETYKAAVVDEDGTVLGTVGVARDISERKATEAAREAALAEAERLARLRSEFLAQMSHELRTPLNGILGYAQILLRDKTLSQKQANGINIIQQSGEHLLMLINDILDLAKIEAGRLELYPNDILLHKFLRTIADMMQIRAEQKKLKFVCDIAENLPEWIHADEKRLRQVLLNLLSNAIKFTDQGHVRLHVYRTEGNRLRFEVTDTGIGISADQQKRIFRPFEQAGNANRKLGGTGLGLAISQQFVKLMNSDIHLESQPGKGSRFWFEIEAPALGGIPHIRSIDRTVFGYKGDPRSILVIDDIEENRKVMRDMLEPLGFILIEAENGRQGLDLVKSNHPDIVLMDVVMPDMNGIEATRRLRQFMSARSLPIIAVSASASDADEVNCLEVGMNAFLPKPVALEKLLAIIGSLLKLEWIYEPETQPVMPKPMEIPPQNEMEMLHRLALMGNMRDIVRHASHLIDLDERYRTFAEELIRMAQGYQSKAILSFVEQFLERKPA